MKRLSILFFVLALLLAGVTVMAIVVRARGLGMGIDPSARSHGPELTTHASQTALQKANPRVRFSED